MATLTEQPAMAMTSLKIRDFRGIEKLDLDFRGPHGRPNRLVVIAGPNGCGKTTVLEAALGALGSESLALGAFDRRAVREGANDFRISAILASNGQTFETEKKLRTSRPLPPDQPLRVQYFSSLRSPEFVGALGVTGVNGKTSRGGKHPRASSAKRPNMLKEMKQILITAANVETFDSSRSRGFSRSQASSSSSKSPYEYSKWIQAINEEWSKFYPQVSPPKSDQQANGHPRRDEFGVGLADVDADDETPGKPFDVFMMLKDGSRISVDRLSSGQIEIFVFLCALVISGDARSIVFIDEPELHLDPQWHRMIIRTFLELRPGSQFVVATHSPDIYDAARSYERHFLVPADDPRSWLWPSNSTVCPTTSVRSSIAA